MRLLLTGPSRVLNHQKHYLKDYMRINSLILLYLLPRVFLAALLVPPDLAFGKIPSPNLLDVQVTATVGVNPKPNQAQNTQKSAKFNSKPSKKRQSACEEKIYEFSMIAAECVSNPQCSSSLRGFPKDCQTQCIHTFLQKNFDELGINPEFIALITEEIATVLNYVANANIQG